MFANGMPSMDKSTVLKAFNKQFFDFLDDIINVLPENEEIQIARNSFETIRKANPTAIVKVWFKFVHNTHYGEIISTGDISFFLDKDYSEDLKSVNNQNRILEMIDNIRDPIKSLGPENLAHSTKYIQNLGKLSGLYAQLGGI